MNNEPDYENNLYFNKLQKSKNVANNVTNENSQDLTEQWKKGKLPEGIYYCNTGYTVEILFTWGKNYHQLTNNKDEVYIPEMDDCEEIIAPIPSYEEWKQLKEYERIVTSYNMKPIDYDIACETVNKLLDDNKRLKHDVGNLGKEIEKLKKQIEIAVATLELYALEKMYLRENKTGIEFEFANLGYNRAKEALEKIKELDNEPGKHN